MKNTLTILATVLFCTATCRAASPSFQQVTNANGGIAIARTAGFGTNTTIHGNAAGTNSLVVNSTGMAFRDGGGSLTVSNGNFEATGDGRVDGIIYAPRGIIGPGQPAQPSLTVRANPAQSEETFIVESSSGNDVFMLVGPNGGVALGYTNHPGTGNLIVSNSVGIGTNNPQAALDVVGAATITSGVNIVSNGTLNFQISTNAGSQNAVQIVDLTPGWYAVGLQCIVTNTPPTWAGVTPKLFLTVDYDTAGSSGFITSATSLTTPDISAGLTNANDTIFVTPMGLLHTSQTGPASFSVNFDTEPEGPDDFVAGRARFVAQKIAP